MISLRILKWLYKIYLSSLKVIVEGEKIQNAIYLFWHSKLFALPKALKGIKGAVMISPSRDGRIASYIVRDFGFDVIQSSYRKQRLKGAMEIVRRYRMGESVGIVPDGPLGPRYVLKDELFTFLRKLNCDIVLVGVHYDKFFRLNTWDKFELPYPFSKVHVVLERKHISQFSTKDELNELLVRMNE